MKAWKTAALVLLAAVMVIIMVATWGSVGSAVMAFGLIELAAALLYQRYLNRDRGDDWASE